MKPTMGLWIGGVALPGLEDVVDSADILVAPTGIEEASADAPTSIPADFSNVRRVGSLNTPLVLDEFIWLPRSRCRCWIVGFETVESSNFRAIDVPFRFGT